MRLLGAVLAGGQSRRFGSDKAVALWSGRTLLDHAIELLTAQASDVVVCGRAWPGGIALHDYPSPGLGPLGGLGAALRYAEANGYDALITTGCDLLDVPRDFAARLSPGPAAALGQPLLGVWPAGLSTLLDAHVAQGHRSMMSWIAATKAQIVDLGPVRNVNTPADLLD